MSYSNIVKNSKEKTIYTKYKCDICNISKCGKPWLMYYTKYGNKSDICSYLCYRKTDDVKMINIINQEDFDDIRPVFNNSNKIKFLSRDELNQLNNNEYSTYMDELYEKCLLNPERYHQYIRSINDDIEYDSEFSEDFNDDLYVDSD